MQFLKNKHLRFFTILICLLAAYAIPAQQRQKTGSLVGTISVGNEVTRDFIRVSPETRIILLSKGKKTTIISNEEGDYVVGLPVGKYCISMVENADGVKLKVWSSQHRCFRIREDKTTRFDISLLE
jgi:hypothetical protein